MDTSNTSNDIGAEVRNKRGWLGAGARFVLKYALIAFLTLTIFHLSLLTTSQPLLAHERESLDRAISVLEDKGFHREAFLLNGVATFRVSDSWINSFNERESAYAATNFPFGIITLYPDFFSKAVDDTERASILLHESQHLLGKSESQAYEFAWRARTKLGWTQMKYGTTESFVTIELQTREFCPELFSCPEKLWSDCTESKRGGGGVAKNSKAAK